MRYDINMAETAFVESSHILLQCINLESFTQEKQLEFAKLYKWVNDRLNCLSSIESEKKILLNELVNNRVVYNINEDRNNDVHDIKVYQTALYEVAYELFNDFYYEYVCQVVKEKEFPEVRREFQVRGIREEHLTKFFFKFLEIAQYIQDKFVYSNEITKFGNSLDESFRLNSNINDTRDRITQEIVDEFRSREYRKF